MNHTKTAIAVTATAASAVAVAAVMHHYHQDIYTRFPEIDHKVARKAWHKMLWRSYTQQYTDEQFASYESMDEILLGIVHEIANK